MKSNGDLRMTRQQYRRLKKEKSSRLGRFRYRHARGNQDPVVNRNRVKRLSARLDKIIAIVLLLIVIVYLILIFVNF